MTSIKRMVFGKMIGILCGAVLMILILVGANPVQARPPVSEAGNMAHKVLPQQENIIEIPGQPLRIQVGLDGSLQVYHEKYVSGATYGSAGSGFFIASGQNVYGPNYTSFVYSSKDGLSGNGSSGNPFRVVSRGQIQSDAMLLEVIQTVTYINGNNFFQLKWEISNGGSGKTCIKAYHAADLYFANDDFGIGYYDPRSGAVGGFNQARDWYMVFIPNPKPAHYEEAFYSTIWDRVGTAADLQDSIDTNYIDNGAALQWDTCLQGGQSLTVGDQWSFGVSEAEVIHPGGAVAPFRQPGPLTPAITTYIPTPLDISLDPKVIGSNLLLAAIAMIVFTIASEILNRTLVNNETFLQQILKPFKRVGELTERLNITKRLGHPIWFEILKLILVTLIYGFIFSLLEPGWKPFSLTGVFLFITMVIAYGFIGLADDIIQWAAARRWKLPSSLTIRPGNLILVVASTAFSRVFGILPGIMFGTPEAFDINETALKDRKTENALLRVAAGVLFLILFSAWLPTTLTGLLLRVNLPNFISVVIGGMESFLLLVFAITVQNIFLQMLALPNTFGQALARWNKPTWAACLFAAAMLFLHTLLNPRGSLAEAMTSANTLFFLITIFLFLVFTILVWLFFKVANSLNKEPGVSQPGFSSPSTAEKKSNLWVWVLLGAIVVLCLCLIVTAVIVYIVLQRK